MKSLVSRRLRATGPSGQPRRIAAVVFMSLLAFAAFAAPVVADQHDEDEMASGGLSAVVQRSAFLQPDASLGHNIPDLRLSVGDAEVACDFLTFYRATGDVTRWGYPTSEVIAEHPGGLTQYYQRGIVDCQQRDGGWQMERRLVWDDLGGLGGELSLRSEQPGLPLGPWGHQVSNLAVDGSPTGFLDFFNAMGGLEAFGHPKTTARPDDAPGAVFGIDGGAPGVIRQYFQAAVFELRPGSPEPVHLRFLGDAARDARYPFQIHQAFQSFRATEPLEAGQAFEPEGIAGIGARVAQYHADRDALVALYHALDGPNWNLNDHWLSHAPLSAWYGVTTDAGRVVELDLSQNQLSGEIPAAIGQLTGLTNLDFFGNQLTGAIPPQIGNLDKVTRLSLWANQLSGSIPAELGDMESLAWVALGINELTGSIPPELGNLATLTHMDFTLNQLSGPIPAELGNLPNVVWIGLWSNQLSGAIPAELGNLPGLTQLDFDHNRLSGPIPAELGNLVNLDELWLRHNQLSGTIPPELGNLSSLTVLGVEQNQLTGEIPAELGGLANLSRIYLLGNDFTGCVPAALAEIPRNDVGQLGLPLCEAADQEGSPAEV
ncbi:MAG: hypothetical protein F4Y02_03965 [Chloroflexi bacterium]|nr:hypothetical protein [Chloroflexota bacterium]